MADDVSCETFQKHTHTHAHAHTPCLEVNFKMVYLRRYTKDDGTPNALNFLYSTITAKLKVFSLSFFFPEFIKVHSMTQFLRFLYSVRLCVCICKCDHTSAISVIMLV